jgi:hypothetical protein
MCRIIVSIVKGVQFSSNKNDSDDEIPHDHSLSDLFFHQLLQCIVFLPFLFSLSFHFLPPSPRHTFLVSRFFICLYFVEFKGMLNVITRKHLIVLCISIIVLSFLPIFFFLDRRGGTEQFPPTSDTVNEHEETSEITSLVHQLEALNVKLQACRNESHPKCTERVGSEESKKADLIISIPTVRRKDAPTYLYMVLDAFMEELSSMHNLAALESNVRSPLQSILNTSNGRKSVEH